MIGISKSIGLALIGFTTLVLSGDAQKKDDYGAVTYNKHDGGKVDYKSYGEYDSYSYGSDRDGYKGGQEYWGYKYHHHRHNCKRRKGKKYYDDDKKYVYQPDYNNKHDDGYKNDYNDGYKNNYNDGYGYQQKVWKRGLDEYHQEGKCRGDSYRCTGWNANTYLQCDEGKWLVRECGPGTVCKQNGRHSIYCGYP
ncbi:hypothetical protein AX774_g7772 [Zancudomyces culisetae]|uniref:Carbohydrate-binding module family 19 domain-containing protein n=1 Tax=Zancudomyces culisetae TaxID=1213189 RepID=A0A1R1PCY7_ZANCU|nr:hypothetical protein AX774_g7772 [Zancudomyces culisetae]|eukprot:OMH78828.1 hypothetical protein AX774_g7772 [Zancudomyces culisetae]